MKSITTFFRTLVNSIISPQYYADILKANFSFSFKYFFLLNALLALITITIILVPVSMFDVQKFANDAVKIYPSDLVVTVKDSRVSINKPLPYAIPMPADWQPRKNGSVQPTQFNQDNQDVTNIVMFDSDQAIHGVTDVIADKAFVVITETSIYTRDRDNQIKATPVPEKVKDFTINSGVINNLKQAFLEMPLVKNKIYVFILGALLLLVILPFALLFRFVTLLIYSVIVFIIAKIFKASLLSNKDLSYGQILQVSLHSVTPAILLAYLTGLLHTGFEVQGWWYFLVYLLWTMVVLHAATQQMPAAATPMKSMDKPEEKSKSKK